MSIQPPDFGPLFKAQTLARTSDPETSHAAAVRVARSSAAEGENYAAQMVAVYPGRTARELDDLNRTPEGVIRKRLAGAAERGLIRRGPSRPCEISGRRCQTWVPVGRTFGLASDT